MSRWRWPSLVAGALVVWSVWHRADIGAALLILGIPFTLIERWRPLRRQRPAFRRAGAGTDAVSFVVNEVLAGLGLAAVLLVTLPILRHVIPAQLPRVLSAQPGLARWVEAWSQNCVDTAIA